MSTQKGNEQANMSLVGHLREIRNRIALSVVALLAAFVICFAIIKPLANAMLQMGLDAGFQYVYLSPSELLTSYFKLALVLAVVVVSPLLIFQIWGFVAPALTKKEKRAIRPALLGGFFFFCLGALFSYMVALPFMIQFLVNFSTSDFIHSAISVANANPSGAAAAIRALSKRSVATLPVIAGTTSRRVSTASNVDSLSSCRSRL